MIEAIAFDFGNVLGFFDHYKTLARLTAYTEYSAAEMFAMIFGDELEDAFESARIDESEFVEEVRRRCKLRCDVPTLTAAIEDIFTPNADLCALLPQLKQRYRLVLGSNTNPIHSRHFRRQFVEHLGYFDSVVLSHDVRARKPRAPFYEAVVEAAGCKPEQVVFVDDLSANIAGARACGLQAVLYRDTPGLLRDFQALGITVP